MATADSVLKIAVAENGYRERGSNRTKYGRAYGWDGVPWCAQFVWWCLTRAKVPVAGKTASAPGLAEIYKRKKRFGRTPRKGAVVFFDLNRNGGIDHVGFCIARLADGRIKTVEGNTADAVRIRYRSPSLIKGYGYPAYSSKKPNAPEEPHLKRLCVTGRYTPLGVKAGSHATIPYTKVWLGKQYTSSKKYSVIPRESRDYHLWGRYKITGLPAGQLVRLTFHKVDKKTGKLEKDPLHAEERTGIDGMLTTTLYAIKHLSKGDLLRMRIENLSTAEIAVESLFTLAI